MPVDFSSLVLAPCMATFAIPITVTPTVSQPGAQGYAAQGIWDVREVDVVLEDGSTLASKTYIVGIRLAEYAVAPRNGDGIVINGNNYIIDQMRPDGQGGARLVLKALQP